MNKDRILALAALLVGVLSLTLWLFSGGKTITNTETERVIREIVGAVSGNTFQDKELFISGLKKTFMSQQMVASNTPCSLQVVSTTTVDGVTIFHKGKFSDTASANTTWRVGTSTAQTATGTVFFTISTPENRGINAASDGVLATSSAITGASSTKVVLRPNDWINVNVVSPSFAASELLGACGFELTELQQN